MIGKLYHKYKILKYIFRERISMKKIFKLIKKVCLAIFILYGLNVMTDAAGVMIPINYFSVATVSFLGIPGLLSLIVMFFVL